MCAVCAGAALAGDKLAIKEGEKIAFLGDSITQFGNRPGGYVHLVVNGLNHLGLKVTHHGAGISGHKSNQMLRRLKRDVIDKKPNWMTVSCGVNDVWHNARGKGVDLPDYKKNITAIVDQAQAAGIKVMILTSTMIYENPEGKLNKNLAPYNAFLRELAKEKQCLLADLNADMQAEVKAIRERTGTKKNTLTGDGVHMNQAGNGMMARGVLKAFGVSAEQMKRIEDGWMNDTSTVQTQVRFSISLAEEKKLREKNIWMGKVRKHVEDYLKEHREDIIKGMLKK
jgi:lysophospholipase L1-like esterase